MREFAAVRELIRETVQAAAEHEDPLAILSIVARLVVQSEADPYLLLGVLTAAMVATISEKIHQARQQVTADAVRQLLADHLKQRDIA